MLAALVLLWHAHAAEDSRLAIPKVRECVESVKSFLRSDEYSRAEQQTAIISACRHADPTCVRAVGDALSSTERAFAEKFLPVVRLCSGEGMGECVKAEIAKKPSYDRNEVSEVEPLIRNCL